MIKEMKEVFKVMMVKVGVVVGEGVGDDGDKFLEVVMKRKEVWKVFVDGRVSVKYGKKVLVEVIMVSEERREVVGCVVKVW